MWLAVLEIISPSTGLSTTYHIQLNNPTVLITFENSIPSFESGVDRDQLASSEAS